MDNLIDHLPARVSVVEFIRGEKKLSLTYKDGHYSMICPFCRRPGEKTLFISSDQMSWGCTTCSLSGDLVKFVMLRNDIGYYPALRVIGTVTGMIPETPESDNTGWDIENPTLHALVNRTGFEHNRFIFDRINSRERDQDCFNRIPYRSPVLDNVAFPRVMIRDWLTNGRRSSDQIGIVSAVYPNLQSHCKLEYPNFESKIFDEDELYDGGSVTWTDNVSGIIKDLSRTGRHYPNVKVSAITTRGFCLISLPESEESCWIAPRDPRGKGRNRPLALKTGEIIALESIVVNSGEISGYVDISGVNVQLEPPNYGFQRYPEH